MTLKVGDVGKVIIFDTKGFDMAGNTDLQLVFTKPDQTQVIKTKADGVTAPAVPFQQDVCGVEYDIPANTYFQYPVEAGLLDGSGLWAVYGVYIDGTPKDFGSDPDSFTVTPRS